ncbi:MAG: helix-turn-helix transcriptional regulator [Bacteroidia bacterium]
MKKVRSIGGYIHRLRVDRGLTLKNVADHLEIDISSLSKIEHGERQLQSHMIRPIAELFDIDYKSIQILFLNYKIESEFGDEPYLIESLAKYIHGKENNR